MFHVQILGGVIGLAMVAGQDPPARLPRENLLVFRGPDGSIQPVRSPDDWQERRAEILRGMQAILGKLPGPEKRGELDLRIEEEVDCGDHVRRRIRYASEPNGRVPAYLLVPKAVLDRAGRKAPAVLCLHPTENTVGHGTIVGLGKGPAYASELASMGYVVLAPSYPLLADYQPDLAALGWESGTLKAVWDNVRGLDLLETLPFVEAGRFAAIGHSLGGHNSVFTAVLDDRLKAVVTCCGLDCFPDYYGGVEAVWMPEKGWTQTRYMPRLRDYRGRLAEIPFDFPELIGAIAPRSVLIIAPNGDSNFRASSVDKVEKASRPVFELLGAGDRLRVEHPEGPHEFSEDSRRRAYRWIGSVLRPGPGKGDPEGLP
ncbi:MAG: acetylxylan esterase [Isosphaeraceae bacterium]